MLLQREPLLTLLYFINSSPMPITKSVFKVMSVLSNYQLCTFPLTDFFLPRCRIVCGERLADLTLAMVVLAQIPIETGPTCGVVSYYMLWLFVYKEAYIHTYVGFRLKTLDTIGNFQRPVFSHGVSQQMHIKNYKPVKIWAQLVVEVAR